MSNPEHLAKLKAGVETWNQWRMENDSVVPDLNGADLRGADLREALLWNADLRGADLREAFLREVTSDYADLSRANLSRANLIGVHLINADLRLADLSSANLADAVLLGANLSEAKLNSADLSSANLKVAHLNSANLTGANLSSADLTGANLSSADLRLADLSSADLTAANLSDANLSRAKLIEATLVGINLERANLTDCHVYGASVWNARLHGAIQSNLVITRDDESVIQVDNLEVAQFIYLLLNNERIRQVIDTITSKVVLILGRFTPERKAVLDAMREALRKRDYLPVLFDFEKPESKDLTGTVSTLANMARFIIADLTDPSSVPQELATIVPSTIVPVQTILLEGQREYAMFVDLKTRYHWVLEPHRYVNKQTLLAELDPMVIAPAEAKAKELVRK